MSGWPLNLCSGNCFQILAVLLLEVPVTGVGRFRVDRAVPYVLQYQMRLGFSDVLQHAISGTRARPAAMHVVRSV